MCCFTYSDSSVRVCWSVCCYGWFRLAVWCLVGYVFSFFISSPGEVVVGLESRGGLFGIFGL